MPEATTRTYQPLGGRRWLRWQSDNAWLAADHLLFVRTRFFSERYTRLYWNDIQALLLYRFAHNTGLMLAAEVACILAAVTVAFVQRRFEVTVVAFCYVAFYAAWRLTRRNYGVQVLTRTATARVPLTVFQGSAQTLAGQLQREVEGVQGHLAPAQEVSTGKADSSAEPAVVEQAVATVKPAGGNRAKPTLVLHGIVFGLGLTTWPFASGGGLSDPYWVPVGILLSIFFYGGVIAASFLQQDPEFPFAVRSAAVMNLALLGAMAGALIARLNPMGITVTMATLELPVALLQVFACLFGLMGIYKSSLDEADKPAAQPRTGSNSLA